MAAFVRGAGAPIRGARLLLKSPRLRKLAMFPIVINTLLFLVGIPLVIWLGVDLVGDWLNGGDTWSYLLKLLLQVLVVLAVAVGSVFLFVIIGNIIAAPFNSALSEGIEREVRGSAEGGSGAIEGIGRSLATSVGRLGLFLLLYPLILLLQFIPVVGIFLYPVVSVLYGAFVLAFDFSDPTLERHFRTFRQKLGYVWGRRSLYLGFGLVSVMLAFIPFINLLVIPICVSGATLLYLEE